MGYRCVRSNHDALSRLKSAVNPESGTINYTYDANGNLATKVDARSITTSYTYDRLNRVTERSYAVPSPTPSPSQYQNSTTVNYYYDAETNSKGKLNKVTSSVSTTEYTSFDILGRVTGHKQTTDGNDYTTGYSYNLSGAMLEQTYPTGRVVKNELDASGDLANVQSKENSSAIYKTYVNDFTYNAAGAVSSLRLGNGRFESTQFNSRLQPTQIALGNSETDTSLLKLDYTYNNYGNDDNNGNILTQTITVPGMTYPLIQTYTYDSLNRLDDANETSNGAQTWRQDFSYDRYGNRNFVEANTSFAGFDKLCNGNTELCSTLRKQLNPGINNADNNRMNSGQDYTYDTSGNTLTDANGQTFVYDGENKQVKASNGGGTVGEYYYDGDGKRVIKYVPATGETTIFIYDAAGKLIGEYSTIVANSTDAKVAYLTSDHLGSPRINTDVTGSVIARHDYHPFGEEIAATGSRSTTGYGNDTVRKQFTGYERDSESELDFAQARYYNNSLGRFTSADEPFADQLEDNPQTWNLYPFVRNNPLKFVDPSGTRADCPEGAVCDGDGNVISKGDDDPIVIDTTAPKCSKEHPCKGDLPDTWNDYVPVWGSFRQMVWNMRCRETGGCNIDNALYCFGRTSLELTPFGWAYRGAAAAQAAPSILKTLCFEEGTLVLTEDGLKPIEEIREGDRVLSFNEQTRQIEIKTVVQTFERIADAGRILSVKVEGEDMPLGVTREHPFYVRIHRARDKTASDDNDGEWVEAGNLRIGDEIRRADGTWAKVESVIQRNDGAKVYNFAVADNYNYFVGKTSLLAHNNFNCIKWAKKYGLNANSPTTKKILENLETSVEKFVLENRKTNIWSVLGSEWKGKSVRVAIEQGGSTVRKLLTSGEYAK